MNAVFTITKRELVGYFFSPIAYVFIAVFLVSLLSLTFFAARFFDANQASLEAFFNFHPWIYLVFVPAVGMRLWSEERSSGTIELLFTLPVTVLQAVLGKFLAGWLFVGSSLLLSFPLFLTVAYLGEPDAGVAIAGYLGSFLMAGAYLSVSCLASALSRNQVISFITGVMICFVVTATGLGFFSDLLHAFLPVSFADAVGTFNFINHFDSIRKGIIDSRDLVFFLSFIFAGLVINVAILEYKR